MQKNMVHHPGADLGVGEVEAPSPSGIRPPADPKGPPLILSRNPVLAD